jgi:four helix bundle protein
MKFEKFEDIVAWQQGHELAVEIYKHFHGCIDWAYRNQICRAVISISSNIAEGFNRCSDPEFRRFLYISLGSCSEVKSLLYLATPLQYLNEQTVAKLIEKAVTTCKIITGLIKSIEQRIAIGVKKEKQ